jgi:hypothetical protein
MKCPQNSPIHELIELARYPLGKSRVVNHHARFDVPFLGCLGEVGGSQ